MARRRPGEKLTGGLTVTQTIATWTRVGHGTFSWDTPTNWSIDAVPNGASFNAFLTRGGAAYTVVASGPEEVGLLETNPNATLTINDGGVFLIDNALANTGVINVTSSAAGPAALELGDTSSPSFSYGNSGAINLKGVDLFRALVFDALFTQLVGGGTINLSGLDSISGGAGGRFVQNYDNTI